jgi:hypothetical protein
VHRSSPVKTGFWYLGALDEVIHFEHALRDPARPDRLHPAFDSGDQLHPNDAWYAAMAAAVDLRLFAVAFEARH